ncbi:MAG: glycosyltransferase family A protein [Methanoregula sp.]|jgi:glycosyltransferase involved in cell wall biosynthesis|uniref:glycosyltransferase family A protein n=1 Tax=Methanoregula sp. TaxID=2052170 RepID=UPI003C1C4C69
MPRVSVIIPCFNDGAFIDEAVNSVLRQTYRDVEIIIVDDGSDGETRERLQTYKQPSIRVIFKSHEGVATARNLAVGQASGEFILPLDADDRIHETYIEKAIRVMESDDDIGIVYCRAVLFGEQTGMWDLPEYSFERILLQNMIFCSALMRKADLEKVGGYNTNMTSGYEDWDLSLSLIDLGREVYMIPEVLFFYRVKDRSRTSRMTNEDKATMHLKMMGNHKDLYSQNMLLWAKPLLETWLARDEYLEMKNAYLEMKNAYLATKNAYTETTNSMSWRVTQPLRTAAALIGAWGRVLRRRPPRSTG